MSINLEQNLEKNDPYNISNITTLNINNINNSNTKNEKKKRAKKIKTEKSKHNISSKSNNNINNNFTGILSEIKQISIPEILTEKEDLYKILQSEIINIDKGLALLNKKKNIMMK